MDNNASSEENNPQLQVVCAAIRTDEGQVFHVDPPGRHHDVIRIIRQAGYKGPVSANRQGFIVSNGQFVTREIALQIAANSGQIQINNCVAPKIGLFSEDLW